MNTLEESVEVAIVEEAQFDRLAELGEKLEPVEWDDMTEREKQLWNIHRATANGFPIIKPEHALRHGGAMDGKRLPKLAFGKASRDMAQLTVHPGGTARFGDWWMGIFVRNFLPALPWPASWSGAKDFSTPTPVIHPGIRPKGSLDNYAILWEPEGWTRVARPAGDPYLLNKISDDLYAVLGSWDLTELEVAAFQAARL